MAGKTAPADAPELEALLLARTYFYALFHDFTGAAPDARLLETFLDDATSDAIEEYAQDSPSMAGLLKFTSSLREKDFDALLDKARDEYTRIFIGPAALPASPYESPYLGKHDMSLFQENTLVVRRLFRSQGYQVKRIGAFPDDHVSIMCDFMAKLSQKALDAFQAGRASVLEEQLRVQGRFVSEHMANWTGTYAKAVRNSKAGSNAVLYPQLLEALAAFVESDATFCTEAAFWAQQAQEFRLQSDGFSSDIPEFRAFRKSIERLVGLELPSLDENTLFDI